MRVRVAIAAIGLTLTACGSAPSGSDAATGKATASAAPSAAETLPPGQFANPVLDRDFPDPGVLLVEGTYYAYATQGGGRHIQLARSPDLVAWEYLGEALAALPRWTTGNTWAPEVIETSAGFVMYYTARHPGTSRPDGSGSQCLTIAVAEAPEGPFVDDSGGPIICQGELGGSIDASPFRDADGTLYLVWKNDGNCCAMVTSMWGQQLTEDGLSLIGEPVELGVSNDRSWEAHVVEAPWIVLRDGTYYLLYSANNYGDDRYAVGYATADSVLGPYAKGEGNPILATPRDDTDDLVALGPGHQSVVDGPDGELWIVYHAWDRFFSKRTMWIDRISIGEGRVVVDGPTGTPQEAP